jgi:hypothetical protein
MRPRESSRGSLFSVLPLRSIETALNHVAALIEPMEEGLQRLGVATGGAPYDRACRVIDDRHELAVGGGDGRSRRRRWPEGRRDLVVGRFRRRHLVRVPEHATRAKLNARDRAAPRRRAPRTPRWRAEASDGQGSLPRVGRKLALLNERLASSSRLSSPRCWRSVRACSRAVIVRFLAKLRS